MIRPSGSAPSILTVIRDWFPEFAGPSWAAWRVALSAIFGLPLDAEQLELFQRATGRRTPATTAAREAWVIVGRRGGKSRIAALIAVYLALFRRYQLARGERGVVMVLASDRRQARVVFKYILALIESDPGLLAKVTNQTKEAIDFDGGITIEIHTSNFRTVRGYSIVAAVCDEIAFWPSDEYSANPDTETLTALRPSMATTPGALLVAISSPYARRGELWKAFEKHHGRDDDPVLVWQAPTRMMHAAVDQAVIDQAYLDDDAVASAEWGAEFRRDIERFISREAVDAVTMPGRTAQPYQPQHRYAAFLDAAGGTGKDSMTLAIAHAERRGAYDVAVLDVIEERKPPFSPESVVGEFAQLLRRFRLSQATSDRYAGSWPIETFRKCGIVVEPSARVKSDIYRDALPAITSQRVELLDVPRLKMQLLGLERRTTRGGREQIAEPPGQHDDLANSACGALVLVADRPPGATAAVIVARDAGTGWRDAYFQR